MAEYPGTSKYELIIKAALEIFSTKGFHSAKIEDIAQEAGVGKGTVYEYFKSKDQLFQEMLKEGVSLYNSMLQQEIGREVTAAGKLAGLIRSNFKLGRRFRPLVRIALLETIPVDDEFRISLREMHMQRLQMIEQIVGEGMERGEFRRIDITVFARLFYGGMSFTVCPFTGLEVEENEIDRLACAIVEYYLKGIGG